MTTKAARVRRDPGPTGCLSLLLAGFGLVTAVAASIATVIVD
jgi:hypothetical protein